MVIEVRGSATSNTDFGGAPYNVNKPTGVVENDLLLFVVQSQYYAYSDLVLPASATFLDGRDSGTLGGHSKIGYKVAGASEPASYTFSASTNGSHCHATVIAFSGVPLSGGVPTLVVGKSTNMTDDAPSVNPTAGEDMLVCIVMADHDSAQTRFYTPPAGMTERMEINNSYLSLCLATELLASSAATGVRDFSATGGTPETNRSAQYSIAIASGAPPPPVVSPLLLEQGGVLLLEDGTRLLLE